MVRKHAGDAGNYIGNHYFGSVEENKSMEIPNVVAEVDEFPDSLEPSLNILDGLYVEIHSSALEAKYGKFIVGIKATERGFKDQYLKGQKKWNNRQSIIQLLVAGAVDAIEYGGFQSGADGTIKAHYSLSTGLPINEAKKSERKNSFIDKLRDFNHTITFRNANEKFNGKTVVIRYERVLVNSEGNAAHIELSRDNQLKPQKNREFTQATYILNDIGGGTYDQGIIRDGQRVDSEQSESFNDGVSPEIDKIIHEVNDQFDYLFPSRQAFTLCATKRNYKILVNGREEKDIKLISRKYLHPLAEQILKHLKNKWASVPEAIAAPFIGGGSLLLKPYLLEINEKPAYRMNLWFPESEETARWMIARAYRKLDILYDAIHTEATTSKD